MILNISPGWSAVTALSSSTIGTIFSAVSLTQANTALQHTAWIVAIIGGAIAAFNGGLSIHDRFKRKRKHDKNTTDDAPVS